jgi:hypothetical protein
MAKRKRKKGRALRRRYGRYGRTWPAESLITRPSRGRGLYDVVVVDPRGTKMRTLKKSVPITVAHRIIREHHQ